MTSSGLPTQLPISIDITQFPEIETESLRKTNQGYRVFYRIKGSWVLRSRFLMEQHLGRKLRSDEHVHHVNEITTDDRIENLRVMSPPEHSILHRPAQNPARGGGCLISKMVGKCGPYLYHVQRINGRQYWKYLGKVGSARAQAAQAAHARIYQPDDEEDAPLNRVGKFSEEDE